MDSVLNLGSAVRDGVLAFAALLVNPAMPGLVALALVILLVTVGAIYVWNVWRRQSALRWLTALVNRSSDGAGFSLEIDQLDHDIRGQATFPTMKTLAAAWDEYRETFVAHDENGVIRLRNSVRPVLFFNSDDLNFGPGFWRIWPGLFVTIGLALTFLGLIAALNEMTFGSQIEIKQSLENLLKVASAKFIMSLTGLACSIVLTIVLRFGIDRTESALHQLCAAIEKRLTFISLESLAEQQLRVTREQREHFRSIGLELVAELGRPLREELPQAISSSITTAMGPLLQQVGQMGAEGMGSMVKDLSSRFSDDVGRALAEASTRLMEAGDRIGQLSDRMDQSSGRAGAEMEAAVARLAQAVDDLRGSMSASATTTSGVFAKGAEQLLKVMNESLSNIRDNTRAGADAMSGAAADLKSAAETFRQELETAARSGSEAATARMAEAGRQSGESIDAAGRSVLEAFGRTVAEVGRATDALSEKASLSLLEPLDRINAELGTIVDRLASGAAGMQRASDGVRAGAEAAEQSAVAFRSASQDLAAAVGPVHSANQRIEAATVRLADSAERTANTLMESAKLTAQSASAAIASASEMLGGHRDALESSLRLLISVLERLREQGSNLDDIDEKLGRAFDSYASQVEASVNSLHGHVKQMQDNLAPALDTLRDIVDQAEGFRPESRRS